MQPQNTKTIFFILLEQALSRTRDRDRGNIIFDWINNNHPLATKYHEKIRSFFIEETIVKEENFTLWKNKLRTYLQ